MNFDSSQAGYYTKKKPNLVNLLILRDISGGWVIFLIRCNFNNMYTSTQSFFEFWNGQLGDQKARV